MVYKYLSQKRKKRMGCERMDACTEEGISKKRGEVGGL